MIERPLHVLFLCTGNSARSILAEALVNRSGRGRMKAYSAGSDPKGFVHDEALALLHRLRFDTKRLHSKSWDAFALTDAPLLDVVITLCDEAAAEACPVWPGAPFTAHWSTPDPAIDGTPQEVRQAFASAFRLLRGRVSAFTSLPLSKLDGAALRARLKAIGQSRGNGAEPGLDARLP
jgi:arsenate reductase